VPLGTAISLPVDDVLARMSPNTPVEDALLDLYLMLSEAGSPLYLFDKVVGFVEKHAGHTFQKGVTLPRRETLIKQMQQQHNVPPPVPIPVVLENGTEGTPSIVVDAKIQSPYKPGRLNRLSPGSLSVR
jgi:hypothetical protein